MRPLSEIEADLMALNRPTCEKFTDAINPAARALVRKRQDAWAADFPDKAARWLELRREQDEAEMAEDAQRMAKAEAGRLLQRLGETVGDLTLAGIPKALRDPREAMRAAQDFDNSQAWSLTLVGGVGTGKTVPAAWLAQQALERGETLTWWRAPSLARQSLYGPDADARIKRACGVSLFVLDDLGAELTTGPWVAVLEDVLGYRHAHAAKSVVTGNLLLESADPNLPSLRKLLGDRLFDRLSEGMVVGTGKGSLRKRPAQEARP